MLHIVVATIFVASSAYSVVDDASPLSVEQAMAQMPGSNAQLSVRMLGMEVKGAQPSGLIDQQVASSTHIVGHLVKLSNPIGRVSLVLPPGGCGTRELTTITGRMHRPACKLAINAGYFNVTNGACIGNVVSHGHVVQTVPLAEGNVNFGIKDGKFHIGYFTPEQIATFEHVVSGVVWLVRDGKNYVTQGWSEANTTVQTSGDKYATNLASRTAVGFDADGRLMIIQVDGSIAVGHNKRGLDMSQLADHLIQHGAVNAINLDGGGSSAMSHEGSLINYPSDNQPPSCHKSGLYQCERPVSTILCVHEQDVEMGGSSASTSTVGLMVGGCVLFVIGAAGALAIQRFLM